MRREVAVTSRVPVSVGGQEPGAVRISVREACMEERRRFPRRDMAGELAFVPTTFNVRVFDISTGGVMIGSTGPLVPGVMGRLRLNLAGVAFAADVQVLRVADTPDADGCYHVGTRFLSLDPAHQQLIERFMTQ